MSTQQKILDVQEALSKGIKKGVDGSSEALVFMKDVSELIVCRDDEISSLKDEIKRLRDES